MSVVFVRLSGCVCVSTLLLLLLKPADAAFATQW